MVGQNSNRGQAQDTAVVTEKQHSAQLVNESVQIVAATSQNASSQVEINKEGTRKNNIQGMNVDEEPEIASNAQGTTSISQVPQELREPQARQDQASKGIRNGNSTQGAWRKGFRRACRYLLSKNVIDVLILLEPQVSDMKAQEVCDSLGFSNNVRVKASGAAGGIWILWNSNSIDLQVVIENQNFIRVKVEYVHTDVHFIFVYTLRTPTHQGVFLARHRGCYCWSVVVNRLNLIDLGFSGSRFKRRRGLSEAPTVSKRLDSCFLLIDPSLPVNKSRCPFLFEAMWLSHPQFVSGRVIRSLRRPLGVSKRSFTFGIKRSSEKLLRRIEGIDKALADGASIRLLRLQSKLKMELEGILQQEELFWFQKSREKWVELGDLNTAFFHASTIVRRRRKYVMALKDHAENWVVERDALERMVIDFFKDLYRMPSDVSYLRLCRGGFPVIPSADLLVEPLINEEIWVVFNIMGAYKALGIDGFQPIFYQKFWNVVRESVCSFIWDFFMTGCLPSEANETLIHLIDKVDSLKMVSQFHPIRSCNVLYKLRVKKISLAKSMIFVFNDVDVTLTRQLEGVSGIKATTGLGKYLGMLILHGKVTKATFSDLSAKAK
ncbi:LOW QUALITY PROTEIN: hypothetical protein V2J09_010582 [Rumex salicifolius]